jgi:hypothetical protein
VLRRIPHASGFNSSRGSRLIRQDQRKKIKHIHCIFSKRKEKKYRLRMGRSTTLLVASSVGLCHISKRMQMRKEIRTYLWPTGFIGLPFQNYTAQASPAFFSRLYDEIELLRHINSLRGISRQCRAIPRTPTP